MLKFILYLVIVFALGFVIDLAVFGIMQKINKKKAKKNFKSGVAAKADAMYRSDVPDETVKPGVAAKADATYKSDVPDETVK